MKVELIYDHSCPNVGEARKRLKEAFVRLKLDQEWQEWERSDEKAPAHVLRYGSPTILVDGRDIFENSETSGDSCRIYHDDQGLTQRVPTVSQICAAFEGSRSSWYRALLSAPTVVVAALPSLTCPLCWPAYTAFLSSLGLGFINYTNFLLPLLFLFLTIVLAALWFDIRRHNNYVPFVLAIVSSVFILIGKFLLMSNFLMYAGIIGIVFSSLFNISPFVKKGKII